MIQRDLDKKKKDYKKKLMLFRSSNSGTVTPPTLEIPTGIDLELI